MNMSKDFKDKVVVITGASSGIGECTAILFAQHGANVVLCGRDERRLSSALQKCLEKSGGNSDKFLIIQGDLSDASVRQKIIQQTVDKLGRLDILVPNAGIILEDSSIARATEDAFDQIMNVNVKAVFFLIKEAIPHLEKTKGCIVNVSSTGSTLVYPDEIIYSMSKAAVDHMTRTFALGLAPKGIRVNAINPTLVKTNVYRSYNAEGVATFMEDYGRLHPLHGRNSTCEEQANVILFLASSDANFVTGECIKVDGGITLRGASN
ncbi:3-oxoacyl-[acyl-carrier-protein] reductase FabG [Biomphalaria glabrata]|uniref:Uncharacterized protein n=1 Tax=Biomphalaria glabrata TaxID=6526 RepID=A0A2C9K1N1_BIOGL|nr:3-oxoacyl-[acyl-carrier-protein] reductase FabG [Biomphalaria glabrata]